MDESSSLSEGTNAEMAELVDAPASKAGVFIDVWVRVPLSVQNAGVIRCGNGVRLISGLVYPIVGSSPTTGTKLVKLFI